MPYPVCFLNLEVDFVSYILLLCLGNALLHGATQGFWPWWSSNLSSPGPSIKGSWAAFDASSHRAACSPALLAPCVFHLYGTCRVLCGDTFSLPISTSPPDSFGLLAKTQHQQWHLSQWTPAFFLKILFIHERDRKRGRDIGRGRSRLLAGSPMQNLFLEPQDHTLSQRQTLNHWATQACLSVLLYDFPYQPLFLWTLIKYLCFFLLFLTGLLFVISCVYIYLPGQWNCNPMDRDQNVFITKPSPGRQYNSETLCNRIFCDGGNIFVQLLTFSLCSVCVCESKRLIIFWLLRNNQ